MILIAILFCLTLQRFANIGGWFQVSWFELYLKNLHPWISKLNEWVAISLIIMPVLLLLVLLHVLFTWRLFGLFNLILATAVLFFCVDARDLKNRLTGYFSNLEKGDIQASANSVSGLIGDVSSNTTAELNRAVTKAILLNSFEQLFTGLFWFIVAGIYGVSFYFLIVLLSKNAAKVDSSYAELARQASKIQDVLDWVPSRLVGLSYSLVGNFNKGFGYCHKNLWSGLAGIRKFAVDAGLATLNVDTNASKATPKENYDALDLINRTLIIWLIALTLVLLGILI
ncbi:MAG: regulatory signaling modulator protein AmpE [bacterium]